MQLNISRIIRPIENGNTIGISLLFVVQLVVTTSQWCEWGVHIYKNITLATESVTQNTNNCLECYIDNRAPGLITEGTHCRMKFNPSYLITPNHKLTHTSTLKRSPRTCSVMRPFGQEAGHLIIAFLLRESEWERERERSVGSYVLLYNVESTTLLKMKENMAGSSQCSDRFGVVSNSNSPPPPSNRCTTPCSSDQLTW